jgi:hypothetical protein
LCSVHVNGLSYDFSGTPGSSYCMTTDYGLQVSQQSGGDSKPPPNNQKETYKIKEKNTPA